jgi:hypothetical protein
MHLLNRFITRYQALLLSGMTAPQATALAALQAALDQMISEIPPGTGE